MTALLMFDALLAFTSLVLAQQLLASENLYKAISLFIALGLFMTLIWVRLDAPDVALAEAGIGAGFTGALLLAALARLRQLQNNPDTDGDHSTGRKEQL